MADVSEKLHDEHPKSVGDRATLLKSDQVKLPR
jgi:hypothetical protein